MLNFCTHIDILVYVFNLILNTMNKSHFSKQSLISNFDFQKKSTIFHFFYFLYLFKKFKSRIYLINILQMIYCIV
jgi:hypothetical protein